MNSLLIIFLVIVLVIAAVIDFRVQKIPNLLTFPTIVLALAYHGVMNGPDGLLFSSGGLVLGVAIFILPYLMGGMGAGDAKLMGAVGAVLGPRGVFNAAVFTAIIGGIYALMLLLAHRKVGRSLITRSAATLKMFAVTGQLIQMPEAENEEKPKLCYGIAIASGALFTIWWQLSNHGFPL
jgi:prepilin peptidase CpaA